ncbi:MAG: aspartate-semialdehyde dehydrogenase [Alphaproteobacteria bacterium 43-37]|nr:MAG: aspartate-semialdehyde dehydrogenase [Alphaproteobacteria bacterium 43-37]
MVKVAVVGATGAVGREMLKTLSERNFPAKQVVALASEQSSGKQVSFGEEKLLTIQPLTHYDFHGTDIALFSAGSQRSKEFAPKAAAAGCYVVDNSSYFRMHQDVTLIVPEVNGNNLQSTQSKIIANPNCVAIPLVMVLKALESLASIERAVVSTYQSVSGKGRKAMDELFRQTKAVMVGDAIAKEEFPKQIAFNLFPHIDTFREDGITFEEWKVMEETQKMLGKPINLSVTCVRVPVFIGHSLSVNVVFKDEVSVKNAHSALKKMPGISVVDNPKEDLYATPIDCAGDDDVLVSRVRVDPSVPHGLNLWIVSDNLRKGAALNAVQIAEKLLSLVF